MENGKLDNVRLITEKACYYPLKQDEKEFIRYEATNEQVITAPIKKDKKVGTLNLYFNNDLISSDRGKKNSYTGDTYNNSNLNSHNNESAIIAQNIDDGDNHKPY